MELKCIYMRGGTSKGCMFREDDLPADKSLWDEIFLKVMGSPDPKQMDGMGGTITLNNKIVIVSRSYEQGIDVNYLVAQVLPDKPVVDYSANCGNMTSAVGPFSILSGLVAPKDGLMKLRMRNLNSGKLIEETVPVKDGKPVENGDCCIAGIDAPGAELKVNFLEPGGAKTGKLLPTGSVSDEIDGILVSVVDIANVFIFINAPDLGVKGNETPDEINSNLELLNRVAQIRGKVAQKIGIVERWEDAALKTPGSPKVVLISGPSTYTDSTGKTMHADDMDLCVRLISLEKTHKSLALTAAIATGGACFIEGGLPRKLAEGRGLTDSVRLGHPCGTMEVFVDCEKSAGEVQIKGVAARRTARRIMEGTIYIPDAPVKRRSDL